MSGREYNIKVNVDNSQAQQANRQLSQSNKRLLSEAELSAKVQERIIARANKQRIDAAARAAEAEKSGFAASLKGADALAGGVMRLGAQYAALRLLHQAVAGIGDALEKGADRARDLAAMVVRERDALREIAGMAGVGANTRLVRDQAALASTAGMTPEEAKGYTERFLGSGAQYEGKTLPKGEFQQYRDLTAAYTVSQGLDPETMADLAGTMAGAKDYKKFGGAGAETALGDYARSVAILQRGKGRNNVLVNQFSMLASSMLNEDEMKGVFTSPEDAATVISLFAEKHDAQAFEMTRAAAHGLRDFEDKDAGPLLRKAGITAQTNYIDAIQKLAPVVEEEAKRKGVKPQDVLNAHFKDRLVAEGLGVAINKGVWGGAIKDRRDYAKQFGGPEEALERIRKFQSDPEGAGPERMAAAKLHETEVNRGAETVSVETLRKQAEDNLKAGGWYDSPSVQARDAVQNGLTWLPRQVGIGVSKQENRLNQEMHRILRERARAAGIDLGDRWDGLNEFGGQQQADRALAEEARKIQAAGGNPMVDMGQTNDLLRQSIEELKGMRREMQEQQKDAGRAKAPPPLPARPRAGAARP